MATIKNIDGLSNQDLKWELDNGGRFVVYQYTISILVMTFRQNSDIYFIRGGESGVKHSIGFTLLSFIMGWWGFPWGPIYTFGSLYTNLSGGKDITHEIIPHISTDNTNYETLHE